VQLVTPGSRVIEAVQGRIPLELVFEGGREAPQPRPEEDHHGDIAAWTSAGAIAVTLLVVS
jgi:hypothetical protein